MCRAIIVLLVWLISLATSDAQIGKKLVGNTQAKIQKRTYDFKEAKKEMEYAPIVFGTKLASRGADTLRVLFTFCSCLA